MASRNITDLHKDFQPMVTELLAKAQAAINHTGYTVFITDGYRSMDEQAALFASGRTTTGQILTMAKPGESPHNYGLAVDIAFQKNKVLSYSDDLYKIIDPIARSLGFVLGADWVKFKDRPHFEFPYWQSKVQEKPSTPVVTGKRYESHRNIEVVTERGINVRTAPHTKATSIGAFAHKQVFATVAFIEGESVSGNHLWWETQDSKFVWSGGTSVIPQPLAPAAPAAVTTLPTDQISLSQVIDQLTKDNAKLKELLQAATIERARTEQLYQETQQLLTLTREQASNVQAISTANTAYATQIEAYKTKQLELKGKLQKAYTQAFEGWILVQLPAGIARFRLLLPLLIKIIGLMRVSPNQNHVIGWRLNARVVGTSEAEPIQ